jgi:PAS domain-containing protein
MNTSPLRAGRVTAIFGTSALAWIVFSDLLLNTRASDGAHGPLGLAKGVLFVAATTALLFVLLRRAERRLMRMEAERQREERRWRQALDGVGDGVWEWDLRTNRVDYAPQLEHMLGYAAGELQNDSRDWQARAHPDDLANINREARPRFTAPSIACAARTAAGRGCSIAAW